MEIKYIFSCINQTNVTLITNAEVKNPLTKGRFPEKPCRFCIVYSLIDGDTRLESEYYRLNQ